MAHCREGSLGFNQASCDDCGQVQWYASSCGDRHCPNCLGPRQAEWAEQVCERLPDCPHFHMVFTVPAELQELFETNYRKLADILTASAADTLKQFQKNNWKMKGGFLSVLHTWGSALNWHPHLHVLVSSGGVDCATGRWREARRDYSFPVRQLSQVFRATMLAKIERLDGDPDVTWPERWTTLEQRRQRRVELAGRHFNTYSKATLRNTRAVVRYLARYTSRIAMSNQRLVKVDEEKREVVFRWKDYRNGAVVKHRTLSGKHFLWLFTRHLVPKGYRRIRYFGLLVPNGSNRKTIPGQPGAIGDRTLEKRKPECHQCGKQNWTYHSFFVGLRGLFGETLLPEKVSFSLVRPREGP